LRNFGATPAFKGYYGYPCVLCTSINEEIVHGIPSEKRALKTGDIVSIDCGVVYDGYYGDAAITVPVGESLSRGVEEVARSDRGVAVQGHRAGKDRQHHRTRRIGDPEARGSQRVQRGAGVCGHGIGTKLHEAPQIPNFGKKGQGAELTEGMVLAIEPMVNSGGPEARC
jgi:methionyl aminopeptidase